MYGFLHAVIAVTAGVVLFRLCMSISSYIWAIVFVLPIFFCQTWDKCSLAPQNDTISIWSWEVQSQQHLCAYRDFKTSLYIAHWWITFFAEFYLRERRSLLLRVHLCTCVTGLWTASQLHGSGKDSCRWTLRHFFFLSVSFGRFTAAIPSLEQMASYN